MIHKMKNRRVAILSRREQEAEARRSSLRPEGTPTSPADLNGAIAKPVRSIEVSQSPPVGFTAVNLRQPGAAEVEHRPSLGSGTDPARKAPDDFYGAQNVTIINGRSIKDASPTVRAEMMKKFLTPGEREAGMTEDTVRRSSFGTPRTNSIHNTLGERPRSGSMELTASTDHAPSVAIPNTPASLMPQSKPSTADRDDGGPFKAEMVRRMDNMWKGDRVIPPCDRCRRLHMDCLKNLTACMGCTKKHAKCSWKEVKASELQMVGGQASSPDRETGPPLTAPEFAPPLSAGSTIEVAGRPSEEPPGAASIARASLELSGDHSDMIKEDATKHAALPRTGEPAPSNNGAGRFDVRPPPLVQQLQEAATDSRSGPSSQPFVSPFSPPSNRRDEDDDEGDRLQALAARVYRTASQSGHR